MLHTPLPGDAVGKWVRGRNIILVRFADARSVATLVLRAFCCTRGARRTASSLLPSCRSSVSSPKWVNFVSAYARAVAIFLRCLSALLSGCHLCRDAEHATHFCAGLDERGRQDGRLSAVCVAAAPVFVSCRTVRDVLYRRRRCCLPSNGGGQHTLPRAAVDWTGTWTTTILRG